MKKYKGDHGSILIVSLWIMVMLLLVVSALGYRSHLEVRMTLREREQCERDFSLLSGINNARALISHDQDPSIDNVHDAWYNQDAFTDDSWPDENQSLRIVDEESKININTASESLLKELFEGLEKEGIAFSRPIDDLVSAILAWRGAGSLAGDTNIGKDIKGSPFESLSELLLIEVLTTHDVDAVKEYLTVYGAKKDTFVINPNTASNVVIKALVHSVAGDERAKDKILDKLYLLRAETSESASSKGEETTSSGYFTSEQLSPYAFLEKLDLPRNIVLVSIAIQLMRYLTVDSQLFWVRIDAPLQGTDRTYSAEAVLGPSGLKRGSVEDDALAILSWQERYE